MKMPYIKNRAFFLLDPRLYAVFFLTLHQRIICRLIFLKLNLFNDKLMLFLCQILFLQGFSISEKWGWKVAVSVSIVWYKNNVSIYTQNHVQTRNIAFCFVSNFAGNAIKIHIRAARFYYYTCHQYELSCKTFFPFHIWFQEVLQQALSR